MLEQKTNAPMPGATTPDEILASLFFRKQFDGLHEMEKILLDMLVYTLDPNGDMPLGPEEASDYRATVTDLRYLLRDTRTYYEARKEAGHE